jgi:hypothetical protein
LLKLGIPGLNLQQIMIVGRYTMIIAGFIPTIQAQQEIHQQMLEQVPEQGELVRIIEQVQAQQERIEAAIAIAMLAVQIIMTVQAQQEARRLMPVEVLGQVDLVKMAETDINSLQITLEFK